MSYRILIIGLLILFSSGLFAQQEGKKKIRRKRQNSEELIRRARTLKDKSPKEAIALIEEAISSANKKEKRRIEAEAYTLLGNIYEQIDQGDLALNRYQKALELTDRKKERDKKAVLYERIGQIYLDKKNDQKAENAFQLCIETSTNKAVTLRCEEGLADVELLRKNDKAVVSQLDAISQNYTLDSLETARIEARKARAYTQQMEFDKASEALQNTYNTLPRNKKIEETDYQQIKQAKEDLINANNYSNTQELAIQTNIPDEVVSNFPEKEQLKDNLRIAELYETDNNLPEAEKIISRTKELIKPNTDAAVAAEVYKKSSEINQRSGRINAALDDLELYISAKEKSLEQLEIDLKEQIEIVKEQQKIDQLQYDFSIEEKEQDLMKTQLRTQKIIIGLLSLVLLASLVFFYFLYKNVKEKRKANQLLLLKSLRTQMNPHFIFNALNSVNNFIAKNDEKAANKFLSEFSKLMRKVLDYSQRDFITFDEEIELNQLYLKLEHFRFRDRFEYNFQNKVSQDAYNLEIPPMLIQPFIENAVWHGLRYKEAKGQLTVKINEEVNRIVVKVEDNGIGRQKSKSLKTANQKKYKSTGLENIAKRIALINELYQKNYTVAISDLLSDQEDTGTIVEIGIPKND